MSETTMTHKRQHIQDVIRVLLTYDGKFLFPILDHMTMVLERELSGTLANGRNEQLMGALGMREFVKRYEDPQLEIREIWARFKILETAIDSVNELLNTKDDGIWAISEKLSKAAYWLRFACKQDDTINDLPWHQSYYIGLAMLELDKYAQEVTCPSEPMPDEEWDSLLSTIFHRSVKK